MTVPQDIERFHAETGLAFFFVGVTGYMDPVSAEIDSLTERFRQLFRFVREGAAGPPLGKLVADLVPDANDTKLRKGYHAALSRWTGLGPRTPIVVLCNLAPGVDTLVANLVLDEFADKNFHLLCPLPFPPHIYIGASTFVRFKDGQPMEGNRERQQGFLQILAKMGAIDEKFVAMADGNPELPPDLSAALAAVSPETFFAVRLQEDLARDTPALEQKWLSDRSDSDRRNRRYYAAGEYLTVSAHLLVAVWNGQRDASRSGTSAVVEARLSGPRHGLLSTTSDVPLQHGGPVWHLMANRPGSSPPNDLGACAQTLGIAQPLPPLRILHPFLVTARDCPQAVIIAGSQLADIQLQSERLRLFARIGESLRNFNTQCVRAEKDRDREFHKMLTDPPGTEPALAAVREQLPQRLRERLRRISDTRCRSSDLATFYQDQVKRTLARLFWITFFAAVALHFFTHWHPRDTKKDIPSAASTSEIATPHAERHAEDEHLNRVQIVSGWLALTLTAVAIAYFAWQRSRKLEAHGHDARAIAEGLRVQFYWNLAGLGKSVSANYMSRHRSELDWIRGVIRTSSIPYEIWTSWFTGWEPGTKLAALRAVQWNWVRDQLVYFRRASHREHHRLHLWHKFGGVAALAGVLAYLKLLSQESWPAVAQFVGWVCHGGFAVILLAGTGCLAWYLAARTAVRTAAAGHNHAPALFPELQKSIAETSKRAHDKWTKSAKNSRWRRLLSAVAWILEWFKSAGGNGLEVVNILVLKHHDAEITQSTFGRRLWHGVLSFLAYVPLSLVIACAACGSCNLVADRFETFPGPQTLSIIAAGTLLLGGALSVAWAEKNLHSELAYQYNTMAILFEAADRQLDKELKDYQTAIDARDEETQRQCPARIQALLFELGQEALDENAEWLLLHRARPLEPVMAG